MLLQTLLFLDFSGGEFLLIAVVFLMFFGSKSIPGMARAIGKGIREFREAANTVQREISDSAAIEEFKQTTNTPPPTIPQQTTPAVPIEPELKSTAEESSEKL
jgi:sec-independent protein translocase protein TatA